MIRNYFTIAWRNLLKSKKYFFINVAGLSAGLTVAIMIGLWVFDEISFNRYHKHYDRIGQLWMGNTDTDTQQIVGSYNTSYPLATTLKEKYSQYFSHILRAWWVSDYTLSIGEEKFSKLGEFIEDGAIEVLSLQMLRGSTEALKKPYSIILSKSTALSIFNTIDVIDRGLVINSENIRVEVIVTGIYDDIPKNSHFSNVQFFAPWSLLEIVGPWVKNNYNDWDNKAFPVYVELDDKLNSEVVNHDLKDFFRNNVPEDYFKTIEAKEPFVQVIPMKAWHLYSEFKNGVPSGGRILFVWLFGTIGFFVLLLACINFINLSTARTEKRAKEVGIRKAIGSKKHQLIVQFLSESLMTVFIAFLLSLCLLIVFQNKFNELADKNIPLPFTNLLFWAMVVPFIFVTALLAGLYPAFYLSSFQPISVLKGTLHVGRLASLPRKILVTSQFTVAVILVIGTVTVHQQIKFAQNRPIGYDRQRLITVKLTDSDFIGKIELLRNELLNSQVVSEVGTSSTPLTAIWRTRSGYTWQGKDPSIDATFALCYVSYDFGNTVSWKLKNGRDFSREYQSDSLDAIIINEAAAKYMGVADPIGMEFINLDEFGRFKWSKTIIGVVEDMVMESPYEPVRPTLYYINQYAFGLMHLKLSQNIGTLDALQKIENTFKKVVPSGLFNYNFVDQEYANKFGQEDRLRKLSSIFSILAILISILGLFGLASYVTEQRKKEIGLRKVMGASVFNLWKMLARSFLMLVLIACLIAVPLAFYLMNNWLENYKYRIEISILNLAIVVTGALLVTIATVSYQTIKAAMANPISSLRID